ncbi:MAG: hypothetical protein AAFV88_02915 [Planctomycetota bacterium]
MTKKRRKLPWILGIVIATGLGSSIHQSLGLRSLKAEHQRLKKEFGQLEITDPDQIHVIRVPNDSLELPPGVEDGYVRLYRVYLPPNFSACFSTRQGEIASNSIRSRGGGHGSWGMQNQDAEEFLLSIAILKVDGEWIHCRKSNGGGSTGRLPKPLQVDSLEEFVFEEPFDIGEQVSFSVNDVICFGRMRLPEPSNETADGLKLYPGMSTYFMHKDRFEDFEKLTNGRIDEMPPVDPESP